MKDPIGTQWHNNSCAYDATIAILYEIWHHSSDTLRIALENQNHEYLRPLFTNFHACTNSSSTNLEQARDDLRCALFSRSPTNFPMGQYTSAHSIFDYILISQNQVTSSAMSCPSGHTVNRIVVANTNCLIPVLSGTANIPLQQYVNNMRVTCASACGICHRSLNRVHTFISAPILLAFDLTLSNPNFNFFLSVPIRAARSEQFRVEYCLRGIIYYGEHHFVCRIVKPSGTVWMHDGIAGRHMIREGPVNTLNLDKLGEKNAIIAIYVQQSLLVP